MLRKYICLFFLPVLFTSCENDLEVIGDWQEVAIVYGLLDPGKDVNYVRVEKAYLGEGNALLMAQQHDSIYYDENLSVVLERRRVGQSLGTIVLERDTTIEKEPGVFASQGHYVYKTSDKIYSDSEYHLVVQNEQSGYRATSFTPVVDSSVFVFPNPVFGSINWTSTQPTIVRWVAGKDARLFELVIRFHFGVRHRNDLTADTTYIDWLFPRLKSSTLAGTENLQITIPGDDFYEFVASKLSPIHEDTVRVAGDIEFILTSAADEFSTYLDIISASPGISQTPAVYTNINSGRGIFSSRTTQRMRKSMNSLSIDKLACQVPTDHLNFLMNNQQFCP